MARYTTMVALLVVAFGSCATPQHLSASIYAHEQRAAELRASGADTAAMTEQRQANRERARLDRTEHSLAREDIYY